MVVNKFKYKFDVQKYLLLLNQNRWRVMKWFKKTYSSVKRALQRILIPSGQDFIYIFKMREIGEWNEKKKMLFYMYKNIIIIKWSIIVFFKIKMIDEWYIWSLSSFLNVRCEFFTLSIFKRSLNFKINCLCYYQEWI
jgi:hypothetical protein